MRSYGWLLVVVLLIGGVAGCSSGGGGDLGGTTSAQALGYAYKGAVSQAAVMHTRS